MASTLAKMKPAKKGCLIILIVPALVCVLLYIPIWSADTKARQNRDRVNALISIGQNLNEAQQILRDSGFKLSYEEPIKPTINKDYFQQLVIVGETQPNSFESFAYAAGLSWMPFTHSESPYVIINASLDGTITDIE